MTEFLAMGGYAGYVWGAYGVTAAGVGGNDVIERALFGTAPGKTNHNHVNPLWNWKKRWIIGTEHPLSKHFARHYRDASLHGVIAFDYYCVVASIQNE